MTEMRASLIVTADARSVVVESRAAADGLRALRGEAAAAGTNLAGMAANTDRAVTSAAKLVRSQTELATAMKSAEASASVFITALDREEAAMANLQGALDPGIRSMREFEAAQRQITQAVLTGTMAEQDAARVIQQLTDRYDAFAMAQSRARPSSGNAAASASVFEGAQLYQAFEREQADDAARAFRALEESLNPVIRAQREFDQAQDAVNRALASGSTSALAAGRTLQQLEQRYDAVVRAQSPAYQSAQAIERALEEEERAVRALMLALDPAARAAADFARNQQLLTRAVAQGTITADEAARSMALLETQQQAVARGGATSAMQMQNASFQLTDVIVQLQGGVAPSVAIAQQLPQLLGGFGALGAVLGLVAAASTPLIAMWMSSGDAAGSLDDRLDRLEQTLGLVTERLQILRDDNLGEVFGSMTGDVRTMTGVLLELDRAAELKNLQQSLDGIMARAIRPGFFQQLTATVDASSAANLPMDQIIGDTQARLRRENYARLAPNSPVSYEDFTSRRAEIEALSKAGRVEEVISRVNGLIRDMAAGGPISEMNAELVTMLSTLGDIAVQTARVEAEFNGTAVATRVWNGIVEGSTEVWARVREQAQAINADAAERTRIAENERSLAQTILRYGEDSREAAAERTRIAREDYEQQLQTAGLFEHQRDRLLEIHDQTVAAQDATSAWADRMADVRTEIAGIMSALGSIGGDAIDRAAQQAELKALNAGDTIAGAARAGRSARRQAEYDQRVHGAGVMGRIWAGAQRSWDEAGDTLDDQLSTARTDARERERAARGGGRSGLGAAASIKEELARLQPSYDADVAAAEAWRDKAIGSLRDTKAGYEEFAADIEAIYQEKLAKAYEQDLKRRDDWASGVERALIDAEDSLQSWADISEDLLTDWSRGGEDAFINLVRIGKLQIGDLAEFVADQFARMAFQMAIQPGLNQVLGIAASAIGGYFGGSSAPATSIRPQARPASIRTNHTGSPGVMRTYDLGGAGDTMRQDEHLTMMRRGEEIMTSRALENASALISGMTALAARSAQPVQVDARPVIMPMNNTGRDLQVDVEESTDSRGQRQYSFAISEVMTAGAAAKGGAFRRKMQSDYGLKPRGIKR